MFRFADQLVRHVFEKTGYIPNLRNHHVKPGVILSKRGGAYEVEGTLWQRVEQAGETELAARIRGAMEGVDPAVASGDSARHAVGLRFESEGITAVASKAGVDVTIPLYAAVYLGGPRWPSVGEVLETLETTVSPPDISTWRQVEAFAMGDGTDLDAIEQFIDAL